MLEFIKTGVLGNIKTGMTKQQVVDAIGQPNDLNVASTMFLYGDNTGMGSKANLQLLFNEDKLIGIWLYFYGNNDVSALPKWINNISLSIDEFGDLAKKENIVWKFNETNVEDHATIVIEDSGTNLVWADDKPDNIWSITKLNFKKQSKNDKKSHIFIFGFCYWCLFFYRWLFECYI